MTAVQVGSDISILPDSAYQLVKDARILKIRTALFLGHNPR